MSALERFSAETLLGIATDTQSAAPCLATVTDVGAGGVQLRLDGDETAGAAYYKRLASYSPKAGDRVFIARVSGTYLVLGEVV